MRQGRIQWTKSYSLQEKAMDVVAVFGLNDVRKMEPKDVKLEMVRWNFAIEAHESVHAVKNTIAFVKIPHAPTMAWLAGDGPFPTENYTNYLHKVDSFNRMIDEMNDSSDRCQKVVSFQNEGQRTTRSGQPQHVWKSWRETEKSEMLHLTDYHRAKMYNRIVKYFEGNTFQCKEDYNI